MKKFYLLFVTYTILCDPITQAQNILENNYDFKQYILDLQLHNNSTFVRGNVTINAVVTAALLDTFVVELIDTITGSQTHMAVDSVFVNGVLNDFQHHDDLVFIPVSEPIAQNQPFPVRIYYHGNGAANYLFHNDGIYVYVHTAKYQICSFSETWWSKVWWPCKQDLRDKADSVTFYITTDSTNRSGSNGILKSITYLPDKKVRYEWVTKNPIDYYLISFSVGPLSEYITHAPLPDGQDSVLLQNLLFPKSIYYETHLKAIDKTKELIRLYSELIGTYPFKDEKYGYCVAGTSLGAMENQTMCTIGYQAFDTTAAPYYSQYYWYTAHELGHQWFGDLVTCARWNDIWLNEGFAYIDRHF